MNWKNFLPDILRDVLEKYREIKESREYRKIIKRREGITLRLDLELQDQIINSLKEKKIAARVVSEELPYPLDLSKNPNLLIAIDPLDGTENAYRERKPFSTVLTVFNTLKPKFSDVLCSGCVELSSGDMWYADQSGCYKNGKRVKTSNTKDLNKDTHCIIDFYYPKNIEEFRPICEKARVRDYGSMATHLAWLASGQVDAVMSLYQKSHELGAGYLMVKKAGGVITDIYGKPLEERKYDFNERIPFIASANEELHKKILRILNF